MCAGCSAPGSPGPGRSRRSPGTSRRVSPPASGRPLDVSEGFLERLGKHEAFAVERIPTGTNLFRLRVGQADAAAFRARLRRRGIHLGLPRGFGDSAIGDGGGATGGARFLVAVNETWNRTSAEGLANAFIEALRA